MPVVRSNPAKWSLTGLKATSSKSGGGYLREVVAYERFQKGFKQNFRILDGRLREMVAQIGSAVPLVAFCSLASLVFLHDSNSLLR